MGLRRTSARFARFDPTDFGVHRREHLLDVADHGVVRLGHDRGGWIGIDGEDVLGGPAADHVLDGAADPAGNVEIRRDPRPGLSDLVTVWPPAEARDGTRTAD